MNFKEISELSIAIKKGSEKHFKIFFETTHSLVLGVCKKMGLSDEGSQEVIQDAFIQFWNQRQKINNEETILGLLKIITKRLVYKKINNQKENTSLENLPNIYFVEEEDNKKEINKTLLDKYLKQLPENQRETVQLFYKKGLDVIEIANHLNVSVRTVENNLYRAKKKLKEWFLNDKISLNDFISK